MYMYYVYISGRVVFKKQKLHYLTLQTSQIKKNASFALSPVSGVVHALRHDVSHWKLAANVASVG